MTSRVLLHAQQGKLKGHNRAKPETRQGRQNGQPGLSLEIDYKLGIETVGRIQEWS
jgi:hypothetical protein